MVASRSLHASNKLNQGRLEMSVFMMKHIFHIFNYSLKLIQYIYSYISCFAFSLFFSPLTRHGMNDSNNNASEAHILRNYGVLQGAPAPKQMWGPLLFITKFKFP